MFIVPTVLVWLGMLVRPEVHSLDDLRKAAAAAKPGDRITLAPGSYDGAVWLSEIRGEEDKPIVIGGADPSNAPIINGGTECLHLSACRWVTVENLVLRGASGNGINADDGGVVKDAPRGITMRHLTVEDIAQPGGGNCDGIKLSGLAAFRVEDCTVRRWGDGGSGIDMVGCSGGVITGCTLTHERGRGSSGIQMKGGTRDVVVRSTRLEHAGSRAINIGGSTGLAYFRPSPEGFEAKDITVEGCTIVGSDAAIAFVGIDGATVRFNTIYHPARWALRILQETREAGFVPSRGGRVTDNLLILDVPASRHPNIGDATDPASFVFHRNFWFCDTDPAQSRPTLPSEETEGVYGIDPQLVDPGSGDLAPRGDGPARTFGATASPQGSGR